MPGMCRWLGPLQLHQLPCSNQQGDHTAPGEPCLQVCQVHDSGQTPSGSPLATKLGFFLSHISQYQLTRWTWIITQENWITQLGKCLLPWLKIPGCSSPLLCLHNQTKPTSKAETDNHLSKQEYITSTVFPTPAEQHRTWQTFIWGAVFSGKFLWFSHSVGIVITG